MWHGRESNPRIGIVIIEKKINKQTKMSRAAIRTAMCPPWACHAVSPLPSRVTEMKTEWCSALHRKNSNVQI